MEHFFKGLFANFVEYIFDFFPLELLVSHNRALDNFKCGEAIKNTTSLAVRPFYNF